MTTTMTEDRLALLRDANFPLYGNTGTPITNKSSKKRKSAIHKTEAKAVIWPKPATPMQNRKKSTKTQNTKTPSPRWLSPRQNIAMDSTKPNIEVKRGNRTEERAKNKRYRKRDQPTQRGEKEKRWDTMQTSLT
jgi:hypothetical protein